MSTFNYDVDDIKFKFKFFIGITKYDKGFTNHKTKKRKSEKKKKNTHNKAHKYHKHITQFKYAYI